MAFTNLVPKNVRDLLTKKSVVEYSAESEVSSHGRDYEYTLVWNGAERYVSTDVFEETNASWNLNQVPGKYTWNI